MSQVANVETQTFLMMNHLVSLS